MLIVNSVQFLSLIRSQSDPVVLDVVLFADGSCNISIADSVLSLGAYLGSVRGNLMVFKTLSRLHSVLSSFTSDSGLSPISINLILAKEVS